MSKRVASFVPSPSIQVLLVLLASGCGEALASDDAGATDPSATDASASDDRYPLEATFPEGGTFDPTGDAFYVGSLGDGSVHRIDRGTGSETVLFEETAPGTWWTLGMDVDVARRRLWVCAMDDQRETTSETPPYAGYVWVFDLETGERIQTHVLSSVGVRATCTDVAVAADGSAYVVDRESPNIYHLTEEGPVTLLVTDDLLSAAVIGQNAIVVLPDQGALLVILYMPSRMVRIDLGDLSVRDVEIDGAFRDLTPALSGADGMTMSEGRVLVAFTSAVVTLTPTLADWSAASASTVDVPAGMTDIIHTSDGDYLLNGQAVRFALGQETDPFALVRYLP